jgi:hypothetical protein
MGKGYEFNSLALELNACSDLQKTGIYMWAA